MTRVDWVIVGFAVVTALLGFRRGLVKTVLSLAGFFLGAVVGARVAPHLLAHATSSHYSALIGLGGAVVGAVAFQLLAGIVGSFFRASLRLAPPLRLFDSLGGLVAGVAWGLVLAWVVGAVAVQVPGHPKWGREARQSKVLHRLDKIAPPHDVLKLRASLFDRLPSL
ncbi:MAG TPA: CvpA family protein [Gaiellaceae bacterium]|jgi:uncharacterized membrane protein required for colicin V production